tara:strand:- start:1507 stop:1857 length:351 start_codon:yes stop_codon:yes gene_type:complete
MKNITTPSSKEEAVYYSDFSGKLLGEFYPPVVLTIDFNYGSRMDGARLQLDLNDEDVQEILDLIKSKLNSSTKDELRNTRKKAANNYEDACDFRDWDEAERIHNSINLSQYLTNNI